jgi:hypothetical protein
MTSEGATMSNGHGPETWTWRRIGAGRYAVMVRLPWGTVEPAEVLVATRSGWPRRPESRDPRWTSYMIGPAVLAIRLAGLPARGNSSGASASGAVRRVPVEVGAG